MKSGFLYVLVNPAMDGLLKVGKTSRSAKNRVSELSAATGVPTPFLLAYETAFTDCDAAEQYVHTSLERAGYRLSASREFFTAPLDVVVEAMIQAKELDRKARQAYPYDSPSEAGDIDEESSVKGHSPGRAALTEGERHYFGLDGELQDFAEARRLFRQAGKLGDAGAFHYLGKMALRGEGQKEDLTVALRHFKEGAQRGDTRCYAEMALLYEVTNHPENCEKCWDRYFEMSDPDDDGFRGDRQLEYILSTVRLEFSLRHIEVLRENRDRILHAAREAIDDPNPVIQQRLVYLTAVTNVLLFDSTAPEAAEMAMLHEMGDDSKECEKCWELYFKLSDADVDGLLGERQLHYILSSGRLQFPLKHIKVLRENRDRILQAARTMSKSPDQAIRQKLLAIRDATIRDGKNLFGLTSIPPAEDRKWVVRNFLDEEISAESLETIHDWAWRKEIATTDLVWNPRRRQWKTYRELIKRPWEKGR
ncbi:MAG: GIY-YIG nuclease family protein [Acidobacteriota bacterium]